MRKIKEIIMSALILTLLMTTVFAQTKTVVGVTLMSLRHPFFQEMKATAEPNRFRAGIRPLTKRDRV